jgi:O-antigen biosynthesis protein
VIYETETNTEAERQRARAEALEEQLARADRELERVIAERGRLADAVAVRDTQLEDVIGSRSWRVTAPLRAVTEGLRRLRRRYRLLLGRLRGATDDDFLLSDQARYEAWVARNDRLDDAGREALRDRLAALSDPPLVSVAMATYETPEPYLREAIASVRSQIYPRWELVVADDASSSPHIRQVLEEAAGADERIKVAYRTRNGHISAALNTALSLAEGDFIAFLDHDDVLPEHALAAVVLELAHHPGADLVYSDEDKLDDRGRRCEPHFKPDWSPELFHSINYVCHLAVVRRELVERVGGLREGFEGSQDYDLLLRATAEIDDPERIRHIPRVLYHWRQHTASTAAKLGSKPYASIAGRKALEERLAPDGVRVEFGAVPTLYRVRYPLPEPAPLVSLIIPTRDGGAHLRSCMESIVGRTRYPAYEILVVDNGSQDEETPGYLAELNERPECRVIAYDRPFNFAAINNFAAAQASGEILGFVNDDVEVVTPTWLEEIVSYAARPEIGAVGAKLLFPDGRVQHGGVVLGIGDVAGHMHKGFPTDSRGYFGRLICAQAVSAVTGACMFLARSKFEEVGPFDEVNLAIAFNDVDLCLRLREAGYRNVWTPHATLLHAESTSRGYEDTDEKRRRFHREAGYMHRRWPRELDADPYYNPNLTLRSEGFKVAAAPRVPPL